MVTVISGVALPGSVRLSQRGRATTTLLVLLLAPGAAQAHAGPQIRGITLARAQSPNLLLSNRGLIFGPPNDSAWRLMCNEALGVTTSELPEVVQFEDGRLLAAASAGLHELRNGDCDWRPVAPFDGVYTPGLTRDPSQPDRLYLTTFAPGHSAVRVSEDGGASWTQLTAARDDEFLRDVRVAPSQPERVYARGLQFGSSGFKYSTWSSNDRGQTWNKHPIDIAKSESDFRLLAVSPRRPDLIVAKADASNPAQTPARLLISSDAGLSYQSPMSLHVLNAAAFSADGEQLWVGGEDGLFVSSDEGKSFTQVGPAQYVDSLAVAEGKLYVGGYYQGVMDGARGVGISDDGGKHFETWMLLTQVTHAVECPATTTRTGMSCEAVWLDWEREILGGVAASSGAEGSAAVGGGDGPPAADSGGAGGNAGPGSAAGGVAATTGQGSSRAASKHHGCSATATVPRGNALLLAAAGLLGWLRGRARRRRQRRAN